MEFHNQYSCLHLHLLLSMDSPTVNFEPKNITKPRADSAKHLGGGAWQNFARHQLGKGAGLRFKIIKDFVGAKGVNQDGGELQPPFAPPPGSALEN